MVRSSKKLAAYRGSASKPGQAFAGGTEGRIRNREKGDNYLAKHRFEHIVTSLSPLLIQLLIQRVG